jgi:drug/metabolite transporter (DMT)-like permease
MERWFLFAILGYTIGAVASILEKYMMNQRYLPVTTVLLRTLFNGLFLGAAGLLFLHLQITVSLLLLAAIPAFLLAVSFVVYLRVLQRRNASEIQPFSQSLNVLFIFLASIVVLHEPAVLANYIGILVVVIGVYLALTEHITQLPRLDRNLLIIAALVPLDVAYALLVKTYLADADPVALAVSIYLLSFLLLSIVTVLLPRQRQSGSLLKPHLRIVLPASLCAATAAGLLYTALSMANASKVYPMAGVSSVAVFLLAIVFLKERFHKHRLIGTFIIVIGIYLISL